MSETTLVGQLGMLAKQRREEIGLNRAALAKEVGIESEHTIHAFEFGRELPSADTQRKLEKALDGGWESSRKSWRAAGPTP